MLTLDQLPLLATPKQAAAVLGPSESQVRGLIRSGKLAHVMVGSRVMIPKDAIARFAADNIMELPCRAETTVRVSNGIATAKPGTSYVFHPG